MTILSQFVAPSLAPAAAEIFLAGAASLILLLDLLVKGQKRCLIITLTQLSLLGCILITLADFGSNTNTTFSGMFIDDPLARFLKIGLYISMIFVLSYSRAYLEIHQVMARAEYYVLALFATLGMMVMISANHFASIYLGLELLSLCLYSMVAMNRDSSISTEAAIKYFILGALASGLLLYGMSMLYGATGTLDLEIMAQKLEAGHSIDSKILVFGLVFIVTGLAFKLGVVPFHMWVPDVYHGAPTAVTLLIGTAPKFAAFAIVMRLLVTGLPSLASDWQGMLMILAVLSMAVGNLAAIAQSNLKRMLAYSAIAHMGFMLLGVLSGTVNGDSGYAVNAYSSALFYIVTYVMMSAAAFGVILLLTRPGFEADQLDDYKGLNQRCPWLALLMLILMFSMAGIPFFVGFFAKFAVLQATVAAGYISLAVIAVLLSLIGAFYYLRIVKLMYFDAPLSTAQQSLQWEWTPRSLLLSLNVLLVALFGLLPQTLLQKCTQVMVHFL